MSSKPNKYLLPQVKPVAVVSSPLSPPAVAPTLPAVKPRPAELTKPAAVATVVQKSAGRCPKPITPNQMAASMMQLAEMLGIHPRTLKRDSERHPNFPIPLCVGKNKRLWIISEILNHYRKPASP